MMSQKRMHNASMYYRRMQSVLLLLMPSLNDRSKLKGQCTDVKSGCGKSVGSSLNPHSLSKKKNRFSFLLYRIVSFIPPFILFLYWGTVLFPPFWFFKLCFSFLYDNLRYEKVINFSHKQILLITFLTKRYQLLLFVLKRNKIISFWKRKKITFMCHKITIASFSYKLWSFTLFYDVKYLFIQKVMSCYFMKNMKIHELRRVWYPGEIDSLVKYDTPGIFRTITRRIRDQNQKYIQ